MSVEELENLRIKTKNKSIVIILISIIISVVIIVMTKNFAFLALGIIIYAILSLIFIRKDTEEFILNFKKIFVLESLKGIFKELKYDPNRGIHETVIRDTQMMDMGDRYTSNDYVEGKYNDIKVIQSDVHIEEKHETRDKDGHTRTTWVTIFRGRWMIFDFNKKFKSNIQVCQKGFRNSRLGNFFGNKKYIKVSLEDQEFNNKFGVFAQEEIEAFYILTPHMMEKIKKLCEKINGKVLFCFIDNKLHIGIHNNKDSFEHSIYKKIDKEEVLNSVSLDIKLITNFIEELDLDNDLFRKEV